MSFATKSNDGSTNNTTAVTVVAAPGSGVRRTVVAITVYNADSSNATVTIQLNNASTLRTILKMVLEPGDNWDVLGNMRLVLDSTSKSIEIKLGGSVASTQLPFTAAYADAS